MYESITFKLLLVYLFTALAQSVVLYVVARVCVLGQVRLQAAHMAEARVVH